MNGGTIDGLLKELEDEISRNNGKFTKKADAKIKQILRMEEDTPQNNNKYGKLMAGYLEKDIQSTYKNLMSPVKLAFDLLKKAVKDKNKVTPLIYASSYYHLGNLTRKFHLGNNGISDELIWAKQAEVFYFLAEQTVWDITKGKFSDVYPSGSKNYKNVCESARNIAKGIKNKAGQEFYTFIFGRYDQKEDVGVILNSLDGSHINRNH